jgi:predicted NAD/FAD-binding protein
MWTARRILKELADSPLRRAILLAFWRHADNTARTVAAAQLSRAVHFREETIRKMAPEKKAELLASRIASPEFEQAFDAALMQFHTHDRAEMLAAFLDQWKIPHVNGSIEVDDYQVPTADAVRSAVQELGSRFERRDVAVYLASLGLLMGDEWREATWPVVDELAPDLAG